jgi:ferredoxin
MKLSVDADKCQGHTLCAMTAPQLFELSMIDGHSTAIISDVPAELQSLARDAAGTCPEQAIVIEED